MIFAEICYFVTYQIIPTAMTISSILFDDILRSRLKIHDLTSLNFGPGPS